jgi:hypothetical protein
VRSKKYTLAAAQMVLVFPAVLFMTALFVRNIQPQQYEPAHSAQQIVMWYAARQGLGLWILLVTLPFLVLVTGAATLLRRWSQDAGLRDAARHVLAVLRAHLSTLVVACTTLAAGGVLAIVALHVATD